nr:hypothetical protein [Tanacetum cinerariifolium]
TCHKRKSPATQWTGRRRSARSVRLGVTTVRNKPAPHATDRRCHAAGRGVPRCRNPGKYDCRCGHPTGSGVTRQGCRLTSVATFIATAVKTLPFDGQNARQSEIQRAHGGADHEGIHATEQHAGQVAPELALAALEHHQRGDRQANAGRLAAADLTDHDFAATDPHVGRNQS